MNKKWYLLIASSAIGLLLLHFVPIDSKTITDACFNTDEKTKFRMILGDLDSYNNPSIIEGSQRSAICYGGDITIELYVF